MKSHKLLLASSSIIGMAIVASPAFAQNVEQADDTSDDNVIIVTAQRTAQDLQDVPAAVTALSGAELAERQISDTNDLQNQIPNVVISTGTGTANSARIFFRGIGEDESRGAIDPAVGIYIDNVYLGRTVGSLVDLVDIEQIEVLRGPQGTLYGRNTNGGAIKITSARPELGETYVTGQVGYGNYDRIQGKASVNLAVGDSNAFRVSGLYRQRDGYFTLNPNGAFANLAGTEIGDEEVFAIRASWYGEMSDTWSVLSIFDFSKDKSQPVPSSFIPFSRNPAVATDRDNNVFTVEPAATVTCSAATPAIFQPVGCFTNFSSEVDSLGISVQLTGEYDTFTVSSTTAFRTLDDQLSTHISFPFTQMTEQNQFSQELLFSSDFEGMFNFVAGAYYYTEDATLDSVFVFPFNINVDTESFALFGQATVEIGDLNLTGGMRWTTEDRDTTISNAGGPLAGFGTGIVTQTSTQIMLPGRSKADYSFTDDVLVYASYSTGFKTPGASPDCFSPASLFPCRSLKKNLTASKSDVRTQFADGRATFNATYFYNDYTRICRSAELCQLAASRVSTQAKHVFKACRSRGQFPASRWLKHIWQCKLA